MQKTVLPHPYPVNPGAKRTAAAAAELAVPTDLSFVAYWTRSRKTYWTRPYSQPPPSPPNFLQHRSSPRQSCMCPSPCVKPAEDLMQPYGGKRNTSNS
jgi:hypothetical protein